MNMIRQLFSKRSSRESKEAIPGRKETKANYSKQKSQGKVEHNKQDEQLVERTKRSIVESKAVVAARKYVELTNKQDYNAAKALLDPSCIVFFEEAEVLGKSLFDEFENIRLSFPDWHLNYDTIELTAPDTATITNMYSVGTHTGEPYGFGPYPYIETTGIRVQNDPGVGIITIDETTGLIIKMRFAVKGEFSGPPGFYKQIGGIVF